MAWLLTKLNPWAPSGPPVDYDMEAIEHAQDTEAVKRKLTLQYMLHLQRSEELQDEAKTLSRQKKISMAKAKLQQSHRFKSMANQVLGQLNNLEHVQHNVETAATTVEVMSVMRDGTHHMNTMMKNMSVEDVDEVADALQENAAEVSEMSQALARPLFDSHMDMNADDDIDAQIAEWQDEHNVTQAQAATEELPNAPIKPVSNNNNDGGNGGGTVVEDKVDAPAQIE